MTKYKEEYVHSDHLLYVQLGENVRKLRKRCHLTQDELAARIGVDQKRVSKIERGEARPNLTLCLRLANAFHVSVDIITHCAPTAIQQKINAHFKPDKLTGFLDEIQNRSQFHYWLFGHYHDNRIIDEKYVMLYEQMVRVL